MELSTKNEIEFSTRNESDAMVVSVKGKVDTVNAPEFEKYLTTQIEQHADKNMLIVNLRELYYISSAGLRAILGATKKLKEKHGDVILAELQDTVREVFEIAGFPSFLKIFETEQSALEQI
jgi:anti-anti-sigma factor